MDARFLEQLTAVAGSANVLTQAKALAAFSRDQHDFSPVLKALLADKRAEVVVCPTSSDQVQSVIRLCVADGVPLTVRGAGSGNYGQAVPLRGGVVLSTHKLNRILEIDPASAWARVEPGVRLGALEREARRHGLELRVYPSTWATATVAGFLAGGFAGVGSVQYGTLWDGLMLEAEVLPMLANPQPTRLTGNQGFQVLHAYGTTGVLSEVKLALAPARAWEESVFCFAGFLQATEFARRVALEPGLLKREVSSYEWPIPRCFNPLAAAGGVREGAAHVLLELGEGQTAGLEPLAAQLGGRLQWHNPASRYHRSGFALSDFTWNHTTLWAIKADPAITYTQARFDLSRLAEQVGAIKDRFGDEVLLHLEFIREQMDRGGVLAVASPVLLRFSTPERIRQIQDYFESVGVQISDPHTYYLDGDTRWAGQAVMDGVESFNPHHLLNPGKIRALELGNLSPEAGGWFASVVEPTAEGGGG